MAYPHTQGARHLIGDVKLGKPMEPGLKLFWTARIASSACGLLLDFPPSVSMLPPVLPCAYESFVALKLNIWLPKPAQH